MSLRKLSKDEFKELMLFFLTSLDKKECTCEQCLEQMMIFIEREYISKRYIDFKKYNEIRRKPKV